MSAVSQTDPDRAGQTQSDTVRHRQTQSDSDRPRRAQTDTDRHRQTQTGTHRRMQTDASRYGQPQTDTSDTEHKYRQTPSNVVFAIAPSLGISARRAATVKDGAADNQVPPFLGVPLCLAGVCA